MKFGWSDLPDSEKAMLVLSVCGIVYGSWKVTIDGLYMSEVPVTLGIIGVAGALGLIVDRRTKARAAAAQAEEDRRKGIS